VLPRDGEKPQPKKVQAILALTPPQNVKQLCRFLGMVQYYRDIWARRSEILAPLTNLVGECGHTKVTRANKTKKQPWHWDKIHQQAFDTVKATIARDVTLAYPDYTRGFEIYTDSSKFQVGAVITQNNRPLAFFSRKLSPTQQRYSMTEQELLAIVETLKEFLVGNVGDMSARVGTTPTLSAKNQPTSNVADTVTEFMAGSRVGEPGSRVGSCA